MKAGTGKREVPRAKGPENYPSQASNRLSQSFRRFVDKDEELSNRDLYRGKFYPFLTARMMGTRFVKPKAKYAYVEEGTQGGHPVLYSDFITDVYAKDPYAGQERTVTLKEFNSDKQGVRLRRTQADMYDPSSSYYKKAKYHVLVDDEANVLRPSVTINGRQYAVYHNPRTGQDVKLYVPPGKAGILMREENGVMKPVVRKWFPFTMWGWAKDLAFEDSQFVHHTDHVYGEMYRMMEEAKKKGEELPYKEARKMAEEKVRQAEAEGLYEHEKNFDAKAAHRRAVAVELDRIVSDVLVNKYGFDPMKDGHEPITPGDVTRDKVYRDYKEQLRRDKRYISQAEKAVSDKEAEDRAELAERGMRMAEAEDRYWETYAFFEADALDSFWDRFADEHDGRIEEYKDENGRPAIRLIIEPTPEEIARGEERRVLGPDDIKRMSKEVADAAMADFVKVFSPDYFTAEERAKALDDIELRMMYVADAAERTAQKDGYLDEFRSDVRVQNAYLDDARRRLADMPPEQMNATLAQYKVLLDTRRAEEAEAIGQSITGEQDAVREDLRRQAEGWRSGGIADLMEGYNEEIAKRFTQDLKEAEEKKQRLYEKYPWKKAMDEGAEAITSMMAPIRKRIADAKAKVEGMQATASELQSEASRNVDNQPLMKVLRFLQRSVKTGDPDQRTELMWRDPGYSPDTAAAMRLIDEATKAYYTKMTPEEKAQFGEPQAIKNLLYAKDENGQLLPGDVRRELASQYITKLRNAAVKAYMDPNLGSYVFENEDLRTLADYMSAKSRSREGFYDERTGEVHEGKDFSATQRVSGDEAREAQGKAAEAQRGLAGAQDELSAAEGELEAMRATPEYQAAETDVQAGLQEQELLDRQREEKRKEREDKKKEIVTRVMDPAETANRARMEAMRLNEVLRDLDFIGTEEMGTINDVIMHGEGDIHDRTATAREYFLQNHPGKEEEWDTLMRNYKAMLDRVSERSPEASMEDIGEASGGDAPKAQPEPGALPKNIYEGLSDEEKEAWRKAPKIADVPDRAKESFENKDIVSRETPDTVSFGERFEHTPMLPEEPDWKSGVDLSALDDKGRDAMYNKAYAYAEEKGGDIHLVGKKLTVVPRGDGTPGARYLSEDEYKAEKNKGVDTDATARFNEQMAEEQKKMQREQDKAARDAKNEEKVEVTDLGGELDRTSADTITDKELKEAKKNKGEAPKKDAKPKSTKRKQEPVEESIGEESVEKSQESNIEKEVREIMEEDNPLSFRNMLKKAEDEQSKKRGAPSYKVCGPNVMGGTMPNFMGGDRDAVTPIEPEPVKDDTQGVSVKKLDI